MRTRCHNMSPRKTLTGTFWWTATWSPNIDLKIWKQVQQNPSKCPCTQFFSCTRQCQKFHDSQFYHRGAAKKLKLSQLMIPYLVHSTPKCITKYALWEASKPSTTSHSTSCKWTSCMWTSFICSPCSSLLICLMPNLIKTHRESLGESSVCKKTTKKMGIWLLPIYVKGWPKKNQTKGATTTTVDSDQKSLPLCWNDHCGFLSVEPYVKRDRKTLKSLWRDSSRQKYKIQEISLTWSYMVRFLSSFNICKKEFIN
jgi:hypothetical protein